MLATAFHAPVMLEEVLRLLAPERGGVYVDGTVGGGGHAEAVLAGGADRLIGFDRDPEALAKASRRLAGRDDRVRLVHANFADGPAAAGLGAESVDGVLLDLGISSHQIDATGRGFSFRPGTPLDMRMDPREPGTTTAADLLATASEATLADIFRRYGEEPRARRLARTVIERRATAPLERSDHLLEVIERALGPRLGVQDHARIFQALRIAVNRELEAVTEALPRLRDILRPDGVMVVLAYHSLEDRLVKRAFREWSRACICPPGFPVCRCRGEPLGEVLTRRPLRPGATELRENPRARSARLRAWRRA